jgi:hypothetical protein
VVVNQRRDPRHEAILCAVTIEAVPEDGFGFFCFESRKAIPAPRGDEIDLIVSVPVFERVLPEEFALLRWTAFPRLGHVSLF